MSKIEKESNSRLDLVRKHKKIAPRRTMIYGTHGIGKSTFAAMSNSPIALQTEEGMNDIGCDVYPFANRDEIAQSFDEIIAAIADLGSNEHPYKTIAIDSLDWLEQLIWAKVCNDHGKKNIEDIGYAKGYVFALQYWRDFFTALCPLV